MVGCLGKLKDSRQTFNGNYLQSAIIIDDVFNPKTAFNGDTFLLANSASTEDQSVEVYTCANAVQDCSYKHSSKSNKMFPKKVQRRNTSKVCGNESCMSNVTLHANSKCPDCSGSMSIEMRLIMPKGAVETKEEDEKTKGGYVKEVVSYMVMDDLVVRPMSNISSITLISKFNVKDVSQLEEKMVSFGKDEALKLLAASLKTDKVLTTIFMH